ncbi:MAG: phosphoribosylanthranilate isomerase [Acidimicrobiales bacterium]
MTDLTDRAHLVKICGVTSVGDAAIVLDAGADALGVVLAASPREVDVARAAAIAAFVGERAVRVGVFRGRDDVFIRRALDDVALDAVQLHDPMSSVLHDALRERGLAVITVLAVGSPARDEMDEERADAILVDGPTPGSGRAHSWSPLAGRQFRRPLIVAGGLNVDNVARVLADTGAWGVDVASGTESSPGHKDPTAVRDFVAAARRWFEREE